MKQIDSETISGILLKCEQLEPHGVSGRSIAHFTAMEQLKLDRAYFNEVMRAVKQYRDKCLRRTEGYALANHNELKERWGAKVNAVENIIGIIEVIINEADDKLCPLCGAPSSNGEPHEGCINYEKMMADIGSKPISEEQDNG
jgi:ribosomal protein S27AE